MGTEFEDTLSEITGGLSSAPAQEQAQAVDIPAAGSSAFEAALAEVYEAAAPSHDQAHEIEMER